MFLGPRQWDCEAARTMVSEGVPVPSCCSAIAARWGEMCCHSSQGVVVSDITRPSRDEALG